MLIFQSHARMAGMLIVSLALIALSMSACGVPLAGVGADATQTASALPTFANCAQTLPEMQGAQSVQIPNVNFPDVGAAALVTVTSPASAQWQIVRYIACMQVFAQGSVGNVSVPIVSNTSSPTAEVEEALGLNGWTRTTSFPFNGTSLQHCAAAQRCYSSGPHTYVELEC